MKVGFERESFLMTADNVVVRPPSGIPHDCGLLVEARGKPQSTALEAAYSLLAEEHRIGLCIKEVQSRVLYIAAVNHARVSTAMRQDASREYTKRLTRFRNIYGHIRHRVPLSHMTAGMHVSLTAPRKLHVDGKTHEYNAVFDIPLFITSMDERFKAEITAARRRPGFYEIKPDGRVEYRSLPAYEIDLIEVARFVDSLLRHQLGG